MTGEPPAPFEEVAAVDRQGRIPRRHAKSASGIMPECSHGLLLSISLCRIPVQTTCQTWFASHRPGCPQGPLSRLLCAPCQPDCPILKPARPNPDTSVASARAPMSITGILPVLLGPRGQAPGLPCGGAIAEGDRAELLDRAAPNPRQARVFMDILQKACAGGPAVVRQARPNGRPRSRGAAAIDRPHFGHSEKVFPSTSPV
jgi:hypothetical protein